jgi:hypothetical protein
VVREERRGGSERYNKDVDTQNAKSQCDLLATSAPVESLTNTCLEVMGVVKVIVS